MKNHLQQFDPKTWNWGPTMSYGFRFFYDFNVELGRINVGVMK